MWKLLRFPSDNTRCVRINFRLLDKIFAYKAVEYFDEPVSEDIAVSSDGFRIHALRSREELGRFA